MVLLDEQQHGAIGRQLAAELAEVESRFTAELVCDLSCVNDLTKYLEQYRGKMLRPTLVVVAGIAVDPERPLCDAHRTLAAVVEMVHVATLVHDDVLDESNVRRRGSTVNYLRGNETAVMLGDYLISHAYHMCAALDSQRAARLISGTTNTVCEGELLQLANRNNWSLDERTYFDIIERKTASLCGTSGRLGAMLAGAGPDVCEALYRYGQKLGVAFQIIDDVLDLTGDQEVVGKSLGKDLEKGKLTLPLIHRLETAAPADRQQLLDLLRDGGSERFERIARSVADSDAVSYSRRRAEGIVEEAKGALAVLPESGARRLLTAMADAVITREL